MNMLPVLFICALALFSGCMEASPAQPSPVPTAMATTPAAIPVITVPVPIQAATSMPSVSDNTIIIFKNTFRPANITVKNDSTVRWVNNDNHPHNIEFINKEFSTSTYLLGASQSFSQRFDLPGQYDFACLIHPEMKGSVLVEP